MKRMKHRKIIENSLKNQKKPRDWYSLLAPQFSRYHTFPIYSGICIQTEFMSFDVFFLEKDFGILEISIITETFFPEKEESLDMEWDDYDWMEQERRITMIENEAKKLSSYLIYSLSSSGLHAYCTLEFEDFNHTEIFGIGKGINTEKLLSLIQKESSINSHVFTSERFFSRFSFLPNGSNGTVIVTTPGDTERKHVTTFHDEQSVLNFFSDLKEQHWTILSFYSNVRYELFYRFPSAFQHKNNRMLFFHRMYEERKEIIYKDHKLQFRFQTSIPDMDDFVFKHFSDSEKEEFFKHMQTQIKICELKQSVFNTLLRFDPHVYVGVDYKRTLNQYRVCFLDEEIYFNWEYEQKEDELFTIRLYFELDDDIFSSQQSGTLEELQTHFSTFVKKSLQPLALAHLMRKTKDHKYIERIIYELNIRDSVHRAFFNRPGLQDELDDMLRNENKEKPTICPILTENLYEKIETPTLRFWINFREFHYEKKEMH